MIRRRLAGGILWFLLALSAAAQITGDIMVNVADATGAAVPSAKVTARNRETGALRSVTTDPTGAARVSQLGVGTYEVKVEAGGFAGFSSNAEVNSGGVTTLQVALEVAGTQQQVVVTDTALAINTVNSQLQNTTTSIEITNLPIATNGALALTGTAPGIIPVTPRNPFLGMGSFNSNGGRGRANNITLDNAVATDVSTTGSAGLGTVPLDAIREFNLITNNFNAEYGRNASSQLQILTKSGTNEFHGSAVHHFRNDKLNARDFFDTTGDPAILRDNNWWLTGGGPIVKDKMFWFGTYEQQKIRGSGGTRTAIVPTPGQIAGGNAVSRQLFESIQGFTSNTGTVSNPAPLTTNAIAFSGRFDWNISSSDVLTMRYGVQDSDQRSPSLTFPASDLPTNGASVVSRPHNATVTETHTFGASIVNTALVSFGRSDPVFQPLFDFGGPTVIFQDGTDTLGIWNGIPQGRVQNTYQLLDTVSWVAGRHQVKFGGEINRIHANSFLDSNVRGQWLFATLNDFLQGNPLSYSQRFGNSVRGNRVWNHGLFVQDDFKVRPDLTLNLGLRLDYSGGVSEVNDLISNLNLNKQESIGGGGTGPLGGFDLGGRYFEPRWNWGPRVGFAWNPGRGNFVVRGGYGIAYDFIFMNPITNGRLMPPFMYNFSLSSFTGANSYANVVAGTSQFQSEGAAAVGSFPANVRNFGSLAPIAQNLRNPQTHQWNLTLERELFWGMAGRVSYVGTKTNFLQRTRQINTIRPGLFTPPQTEAEEAARRDELVNLNARLSPNLTTPTIRIDPRFTTIGYVESSANSNYHAFQFFLDKRVSNGYSWSTAYTWSKSIDDNSDVLNVLAFDVPGQQNPFDNRNNRAVSAFDVPHRLVITHVFQPQIFSHLENPFARHVLAGWEFSGIFQAQSGFPVNLLSGSRLGLADTSLLGVGNTGSVRPNLVGSLNLEFDVSPGVSTPPDKRAGSGLAQPLVGHFGNFGRNALRLNPLIQADWTVGKSFPITERMKLQFQAQAINVFNNTTFSSPEVRLSSANFGYYFDTDTDSRRISLLLRLRW